MFERDISCCCTQKVICSVLPYGNASLIWLNMGKPNTCVIMDASMGHFSGKSGDRWLQHTLPVPMFKSNAQSNTMQNFFQFG